MSEQLPELFGLTVRQQRERLGWSQERLAESADLNRSYVGELERGQAVPSLITLDKLARALGQSPSKLLAQTESLSQQRLISGLRLTAIAC